MGLKAALFAFLTAREDLRRLVADRIYPHAAPARAAYPYVVYRIATRPHLEPGLLEDGPMRRSTVELDVWGDDVDQVEVVVDALREILPAATMASLPSRRRRAGETETEGDRIPRMVIRKVTLIGDVDDDTEARAGLADDARQYVTQFTVRVIFTPPTGAIG